MMMNGLKESFSIIRVTASSFISLINLINFILSLSLFIMNVIYKSIFIKYIFINNRIKIKK